MAIFKIGDCEIKFIEATKHHPVLPLQIGRTLEDGTYDDIIVSEDLRKAVLENPDEVYETTGHIYKDGRLQTVRNKMVKLYNPEYPKRDFDYYSVGAMNTKQDFVIRFHFMFESTYAVLLHEFKSSGSFAVGFNNMFDSSLGDAIEEALEKEYSESGIRKGDTDEYSIFAVSMKDGWADEIEVSHHDLENALIGVELLHFNMEIIEDEKELEAMK